MGGFEARYFTNFNNVLKDLQRKTQVSTLIFMALTYLLVGMVLSRVMNLIDNKEIDVLPSEETTQEEVKKHLTNTRSLIEYQGD
jgi:hypothetical protein